MILSLMFLICYSCRIHKSTEIVDYKEVGPIEVYFNDNDTAFLYDNFYFEKTNTKLCFKQIDKDSIEKSIRDLYLYAQLMQVILHDKQKIKLVMTGYSNKIGDSSPSTNLLLKREKSLKDWFLNFDSCFFKKYYLEKKLVFESIMNIDSLTDFKDKKHNSFDSLKARRFTLFVKLK